MRQMKWWTGKKGHMVPNGVALQTENGQARAGDEPGSDGSGSPAPDTSPSTNFPPKPEGCTCNPMVAGDPPSYTVFIHFGDCLLGRDKPAHHYSEVAHD